MTIPVFKPLIDKKTINAATNSLKLGWLGMGKSVDEFEKKIKSVCNINNKYVITVNTGYSAIHTALLLMNIRKDDEVITPAFNNIADLQSILSVGGKIVFADIDKSLCIDPHKLENLITKKTKAIIVCDYGMRIANHDKINTIAKRYNIRVLHDAAHSFGSSFKNRKIDLLKLDCEGAEFEILKKSNALEHVRFLSMEYHLPVKGSELVLNKLISRLHELNFKVIHQDRRNVCLGIILARNEA